MIAAPSSLSSTQELERGIPLRVLGRRFEGEEGAAPLFRYVRHEDVLRYFQLGWAWAADLGDYHGEWSCLMSWPCGCRVVEPLTCGWSYVVGDPTPEHSGPWRYRWEAQECADELNSAKRACPCIEPSGTR